MEKLKSENVKRVTIQDFLAWLYVVELEDVPSDQIRDILNALLAQTETEDTHSLTETELVEEFYDRVEAQLDAEAFDLDEIRNWPDAFAALQKGPLLTLESMEAAIEEIMDRLQDHQISSIPLQRFQYLLKNGAATLEEVTSEAVVSALDAMERVIHAAWVEYHANPFKPEAITAESVATHRFLLEGFDCWFDAFDLVHEGALKKAILSANEGNRLMTAVSIWSDSLLETDV